ncbi:MAG: sensor histidine kinase [Trichocoleus desertorum ATA4-8-CV12]|jgi:signal transduction histidine kinase|nr:sensor histidine kinase [Trichocoleus desertorum ATA4-8-CV12]
MIALQRSLKPQLNPFRFLLYAEWVMIATCFSFAIMESFGENQVPVQHVLVLAVLSVMAAILPSGKLTYKLLYVGIEIGLIFYGATLGYLHVLPTLYLIVLIQSCFLFKPPMRWIVAGLSFLLFLVHQVRYVQNITLLVEPSDRHLFWMHLIAETLMFGLGLFFVLKLVSTLLSERKAKEALAAAHEQLRQYALQIEELAAVQERNHIAREIHDSLGHTLTAQNIQLQTAAKLWQRDPDQAHTFLQQAQQLAATAMQEVRRSVRALREDSEEPPLEEAIAHLAKDFQQGTGVEISTSIKGQTIICPRMSKTLHRIVQEALTNIRKHAQATQVNIQLSTTAIDVNLVIEDNGQGFDPNQQSNGFGLQGMRERVAAISGTLQLETKPEGGCRIIVKLPLQNHPERHERHPGERLEISP